MAARLGDVEAVRVIAETHARNDVNAFLEMRMVLTCAAERGHFMVCVVLLDELGCLVDGVRDPRNKPEWCLRPPPAPRPPTRCNPRHARA